MGYGGLSILLLPVEQAAAVVVETSEQSPTPGELLLVEVGCRLIPGNCSEFASTLPAAPASFAHLPLPRRGLSSQRLRFSCTM